MTETANLLRDLLAELSDIATFTSKGRQVFMADRMAQKAVIRSYEVISEIVKRILQSVRDSNPQIDWRQLAAFRDFLAHNYDAVRLENVWKAIEDLPQLRANVESLYSSLSQNDSL
jgi:uncharacterized protein with HEPN domain